MSPTMEQEKSLQGLLSTDEAVRCCRLERLRGGTIVFTNGVFDILHRGHLDYLREARELGSMLVIGLNSDESVQRIKGPARPLFTMNDRAAALLALRCVDIVVPFVEDTPLALIEGVNPHILVKGGDYIAENVVGYNHVTKHGGKVMVLPFAEGYSTSGLIQTIVERFR
jgi:D-beta-D-heptose 7-phosphate kinase / D-beta-D-heptose 1-phosphate adenosyltransferase